MPLRTTPHPGAITHNPTDWRYLRDVALYVPTLAAGLVLIGPKPPRFRSPSISSGSSRSSQDDNTMSGVTNFSFKKNYTILFRILDCDLS